MQLSNSVVSNVFQQHCNKRFCTQHVNPWFSQVCLVRERSGWSQSAYRSAPWQVDEPERSVVWEEINRNQITPRIQWDVVIKLCCWQMWLLRCDCKVEAITSFTKTSDWQSAFHLLKEMHRATVQSDVVARYSITFENRSASWVMWRSCKKVNSPLTWCC